MAPSTPKRVRAGQHRSNKLSGKIRIFAIMWFVLVAVTLICLLFLFVNIMKHSDNPSLRGGVGGGSEQRNLLRQEVKNLVEDFFHRPPVAVADGNNKNNGNVLTDNNNKNNNNKPLQINKPVLRVEDAVTVGFAVSVTGCGSDPLTEGAAVLKHSIHRASIRGDLGGRYNYKLYGIYHPQAIACAKTLEALGFELLQRETFVKVDEIKGEYLRKNIEKNGCCGEKEFIKLEAYTLTQHPIVVHLDLDVLVLKPLDSLFDAMMMSENQNHKPDEPLDLSQIEPQYPPQPGDAPTRVNAFFTRDYNMVGVKKKYKPVQGGFLVLRPSMEVYNEFKSIALEGDFREKGGWGGKVGPFYGAMTFQGIMPYYYDVLHPGEAIELNRCVVNNMCDNPRDQKTVNDVVHGRCRTGQEDCEDCRSRPLDQVLTTHYTLCQKPWLCMPHDQDMLQHRLCRKLHHEWFRIRSELEISWGRTGRGSGEWQTDQFYGYCKQMGNKGYEPIATPYGTSV